MWSQPTHDIDMAQHHFSSNYPASIHSRDSSSASNASMPITPTFSTRSHWQSSTSSIGSTPDSPVMVKSSLDDLVEAPEESDDLPLSLSKSSLDDDFCMCDKTFCAHQRKASVRTTMTVQPSTAEWTPGDDAHTLVRRSSKRQRSGDSPVDGLTSRFGRRFNSISHKWRDSQATTIVSSSSVHGTTPTRSSSLRLPNVKNSLANALELGSRSKRATSLGMPQDEDFTIKRRHVEALSITAPPTPIDEDPIDRLEMSRTPLLPPLLNQFHSRSEEVVMQSPLQSPSIASPSIPGSDIQSPVSAPASGLATPPLSTRPSFASFHPHHYNDIPTMDLAHETDSWTLRLGHANFFIHPEPYMPAECTKDTCKRLVDDWESARMQYMRKIADVAEDYGPTSKIFKLTQQKWSEIDDLWRYYHGLANAKAGASGENLIFQPLAEHGHAQTMPSLTHDPNQPAKFPEVDAQDIVGPMVQYAKLHESPVKKPAGLLRIFTDSASLLTKPPFSLRRG